MSWEFDWLYALQELHSPVMDALMVFFSRIGDAGMIWIIFAIIMLAMAKYRNIGWQMIAAMAVTFIIGNLILKNLFARERPCWIDESVVLLLKNPKDFSFPSGHSMNGFAASVAIVLNNRRIGIPAVLLAGMIAFSRLYHFVHFPTDVFAGILLGSTIAIIVHVVYVRLSKTSKNN